MIKYIFISLVMLVFAITWGLGTVCADDTNQDSNGLDMDCGCSPSHPPYSMSNTNGGASSANWTPVCPLCQTILPYNGELDSPFYITYHKDIWGNNVMDTIVRCKVCGYDGSKSDISGIIINPVTAKRLSDWGERNWDINKK